MRKRFALVGLLIALVSGLASGGGHKRADKAVEGVFEAWNAHDPDKVVSFYTDDVEYEDVTYGLVSHGHAELRKFAADFLTAVPDLKLEMVSTSFENSQGSTGRGSAEWVLSGTDVGLYKTGKKFSVRGASRFEMRGEKFLRNEDFYDSATIMRQVGVLPAAKE